MIRLTSGTVMHLTLITALVTLSTFPAVPAVAQVPTGRTSQKRPTIPPRGVDKSNLYQEVEYIAGHEGLGSKRSGQLVVTTAGVGFFDNKGKDCSPSQSAPYEVLSMRGIFVPPAWEASSSLAPSREIVSKISCQSRLRLTLLQKG